VLTTVASQRFDNRVAQLVAALFGGLFVLIGLSGFVAAASPGTATVYLLFGIYTIVRGRRSSLVIVDGSGVTTRSMVRTRRYPWSELRRVEVVVGRTGFAGFGREHLVFHRADGQDVVFKELNCPPPKDPGTSSVVQRAAASINERVAGG
jgi:hypothetical protein